MTGDSILEKVTQTSAAVARPQTGPGMAEDQKKKTPPNRRRSKQKERFALVQERFFPKSVNLERVRSARQRRQQVAEQQGEE